MLERKLLVLNSLEYSNVAISKVYLCSVRNFHKAHCMYCKCIVGEITVDERRTTSQNWPVH
jgi:hypothetical protein